MVEESYKTCALSQMEGISVKQGNFNRHIPKEFCLANKDRRFPVGDNPDETWKLLSEKKVLFPCNQSMWTVTDKTSLLHAYVLLGTSQMFTRISLAS